MKAIGPAALCLAMVMATPVVAQQATFQPFRCVGTIGNPNPCEGETEPPVPERKPAAEEVADFIAEDAAGAAAFEEAAIQAALDAILTEAEKVARRQTLGFGLKANPWTVFFKTLFAPTTVADAEFPDDFELPQD